MGVGGGGGGGACFSLSIYFLYRFANLQKNTCTLVFTTASKTNKTSGHRLWNMQINSSEVSAIVCLYSE